MFDVSPILTRVLTKGSVPAGISNSADKVLGFFSIRMAMACVFGSLLSTAIGTTAPFSAMSGAVISIALLAVDPLPPSAFTVSATPFVSNAALFHSCASASPGLMIPAAARASTPPVFSTSRRLASTSSSLDGPGNRDSTVAAKPMRRKRGLIFPSCPVLGWRMILPIRTVLCSADGCIVIYSGLLVFGLMCLVCSGAAALLCYPLSKERGRVAGRRVTSYGFRCYLWLLTLTGAFRFDLRALDALRDAGPLIIAPNHPSLLDAVLVLSRLPDVTCVMKAELINNPIYGASARLAGYIRNDEFIGSVTEAVKDLRAGAQLLLFPEGSGTTRRPWNPLN